MRIGIDARKLMDYGIGAHIRNVVLPAARRLREEEFFLFADSPLSADREGHMRWIPERSPKYSVREQYRLARMAADLRLQVFHSPHYTLPLGLRCRSIVTVHDLIHFKFPGFFPYWKVKAAQMLVRRVLKKADIVLTVSRTSRDDLVDFSPAIGGKIRVIHNRLSPEWLQPAPAGSLSSIGLTENDYMLYVGNFKRHKDLPTLVAAFELLKDPPVLVLAGNPSELDGDLAERIFSNRRIRVLGFMEGELLRELYAAAVLFVFPSLYEGFGYPPLEAMISGTPVVSSDAPALREVLAEAPIYFERGNVESLADRLQAVLDSDGLRKELREKGRRQALLYTSDDSIVQMSGIYGSLAGR
jgi:glycosyltransferase involved in cell wall biosynthesis